MGKVNPNFNKFFSNATAAGYSAGEVISFLENVFSTPSIRHEKSQLQSRQREGHLRSDEAENLAKIQQTETPAKFARAIPGIASRIGGAGFAATTLPGLIEKGLGAISQKGKATPMEEEGEAGPEIEKEQSQPSGPGGFQQFIKQNPELGKYLDERMQHGASPVEAGIQAKKVRRFQDLIKGIESKVGQPFEQLLEYLFQGQGGQGGQGRQNAQQKGPSPAMNAFMQAVQAFEQIRKK